MSTKVMRIESDCVDIIRKYTRGGSLTDGIREMERRLRDGEKAHEVASWIPGANLQDGMSPEYWARLRKEVRESVGR